MTTSSNTNNSVLSSTSDNLGVNSFFQILSLLVGLGIGFQIFKMFKANDWAIMYTGLSIFGLCLIMSFILPFIYKLNVKDTEIKYFNIQLILFSFLFMGAILAVYAITMFKI